MCVVTSRWYTLFQATAIDEKIGYPEYLGSTDAQELEKIYADVTDEFFLHVIAKRAFRS